MGKAIIRFLGTKSRVKDINFLDNFQVINIQVVKTLTVH